MNYYTSQIPPTLAEKLKEKGETMTSEEKAKELVSEANTIDLLNRMAAWKDQQFKEYLEKKRNNANMAYIISNDANEDYLNGKADAIQEIINERFKEEEK